MTTEELRAAAERLRRWASGEQSYRGMADPARRRRAETLALANAYFADHPAAAEEVPIHPPDLSFESVNQFVHHPGQQFEHLQWLCLSLASTLEAVRAKGGSACDAPPSP